MILTLRINAVALGAGPKMLGLPQLMLKCVDADCSSRTPINYTPSPCPSAVTATRSTLNFPMPATSVVLFPQLLYHPFKNKQLLLISHISPIDTFSISMRCVPWNADYQPSHYGQLQRVQDNRFLSLPVSFIMLYLEATQATPPILYLSKHGL